MSKEQLAAGFVIALTVTTITAFVYLAERARDYDQRKKYRSSNLVVVGADTILYFNGNVDFTRVRGHWHINGHNDTVNRIFYDTARIFPDTIFVHDTVYKTKVTHIDKADKLLRDTDTPADGIGASLFFIDSLRSAFEGVSFSPLPESIVQFSDRASSIMFMSKDSAIQITGDTTKILWFMADLYVKLNNVYYAQNELLQNSILPTNIGRDIWERYKKAEDAYLRFLK